MSGFLLLAAEGSGVLPGGWTLIIIGAAAFFLPLIARSVGLPAVVLEILFGLLIGPEVLGIVARGTADFEFIEFLAELGLLLLMFLAGFEIDFERLERQGSGPIFFGLLMFGLFLGAMWFGFGLLDLESTNQRIFLTLLTAAASLGIVIPALRDTSRSATPLGQITIVAAVLAEFLSAAGIVIFGVWVLNGFGWGLVRVPALFAILAVILIVMRRMAWWFPERFERLFTTHDPDELGIRASLALLLVFVGISVVLKVEPILGAFLAGAAFAFVFRNSGELETRLAGFAYGFFIPVFFISVGVRFPLSVLQDSGVLTKALLLILIAIGGKLIASLILQLRSFTLRESLGAGVLLAGQLSVIIALAEFGRNDLGVIDEGLEAGAILLVGVTAVFSPILFRLMLPPLEPAADESPSAPNRFSQ
ncbi:MAG TPA: cation:proton antiporter [Acidimicrobiia bacterium]|jgi:Kef-type K+ transport system membrane component KefB|nr:cation:proton antiporter [Acidimicrobiia bacterium]